MLPALRVGGFGAARENGERNLVGQLSYHRHHLQIDMKADRNSQIWIGRKAR